MKYDKILKLLVSLLIACCLVGCGEKKEDIKKNDNSFVQDETIDLDSEIQKIEAANLDIMAKLQDSATQADMNNISGQEFMLWDDEMNSLWDRYYAAISEDSKETAQKEQTIWVEKKEIRVKAAGADFEGGSMQPLIENSKATELTRVRCYQLAQKLAEVTGGKFTLEIPNILNLHFVDLQGTDSIYSELTLTETDVDAFTVTVSIYRLAELEGRAILQEDGSYSFEDESLGVSGIIHINDADSNATFEVTKTEGNLFTVGEIYEFPERKLDE